MLASQRHRAISALVSSQGGASNLELTRALGVSETTVRRDLTALHERGVLRRVHGGALPVGPDRKAPRSTAPRVSAPQVSARPYDIARTAATLATPGSTIALSGGAGTLPLARALTKVPDLTVVTTSLPVADALRGARHREHIVVGGISTRNGHVGALTLATIESLHVDTVFLAAHGVQAGRFTAASEPEADIGRALIAAARRTVVLADRTAWGRTGAAPVARLDQADAVITDSSLGAEARSPLGEHVPRLILACDPSAAGAAPNTGQESVSVWSSYGKDRACRLPPLSCGGVVSGLRDLLNFCQFSPGPEFVVPEYRNASTGLCGA
ncbi:DeoR/GlpR family DNA-binding transcription regulator [Streptomyces sp. CBMA29]|uniref:DeoR/GlpR family DNA-binding transcription regulator n=1 Tax=Streptomyces sp. CBMA29 TaxID=1896314 RepID=UPI001661D025|nr:DeoR/GlpR family DNA-binding transcription regulator [Streptomyces sp. CBMA29]MBD0740333.1 hypothetical protein [Streptomyces sp. CBMA29]